MMAILVKKTGEKIACHNHTFSILGFGTSRLTKVKRSPVIHQVFSSASVSTDKFKFLLTLVLQPWPHPKVTNLLVALWNNGNPKFSPLLILVEGRQINPHEHIAACDCHWHTYPPATGSRYRNLPIYVCPAVN